MKKIKQTFRLTTILGIGALTGPVAIAALAGLFRIENSFMIAFSFISGPGAIITASLLDGDLKQRMIAALIAGIISTVLVVLAAGFGPKILSFVNLDLIKIFGGISVLIIGLIIMGVKIPEKTPLLIMILGIIFSLALKFW